jgi:hypothetical protein
VVVVERRSFTALQSVVTLLAGFASIAGAAYSAVEHFHGEPGEVMAIVRDDHATPVGGASVEILTPTGTLVTTVAESDAGVARRPLAPGDYRLHVSHPQFADAMRDVHVSPGETAEVRVSLARREPSEVRTAAPSHAPRPRPSTVTPGTVVDRSVNATRRFLGRLGL